MATFQMTLDDNFKQNVDELFDSLGMDTETAVRMFFKASLARNGIPFAVKHYKIPEDLEEAIRDARMKKISTDLLTPSKRQWRQCWETIKHVKIFKVISVANRRLILIRKICILQKNCSEKFSGSG